MAKRPGRTVKLSISLDESDFAFLQKRAKVVSGGNISAAVSEAIHIAEELQGRDALAAWLGEGREEPGAETLDAIRAEWRGAGRAGRRGKRRTRAA
jgi:hypothetical protein